MRQKKGFTLIELLVVIAIIGILTAVTSVSFIAIRKQARDSKRKADLRSIQSALEIYRADNGAYPVVAGWPGIERLNATACPTSQSLSSGGNVYMQKIPCDPSSSWWLGGNYDYVSDGKTYTLEACLENPKDPDGQCFGGACGGTPACADCCQTNTYYLLRQP